MKRRIARAERAALQQPRQCPACAGWPDLRIEVEPADCRELYQRYGPRRMNPPSRCTACGWEPLTMAVRYVDDWREIK
jgi:predicted Zn-ribbon and HTH transcriptional regulator